MFWESILAEYYFDVETTGTNFDKDEIITIQWQELGFSGEPIGKLNILKSWESSEKEVLKQFFPNLTCNPWNFIFIGKNMGFDFAMLGQRLKHHKIGDFNLCCLQERVTLDIKPLLILLNDGRFSGYHRLLPKTNPTENKDIPELYKKGKFDEIVQYIVDEAKDFTDSFQKLKKEVPLLKERLFPLNL
jgi:hypothetical protein